MSYCVEEEERQKAQRVQGFANVVSLGHNNKRKHNNGDCSKAKKKLCFSPKPESSKARGPKPQAEIMCLFCKKQGHMQRDCAGFKKWLAKKGNDIISFVDESLYADFPLVLGGLTQVPPCTLPIHCRDCIP